MKKIYLLLIMTAFFWISGFDALAQGQTDRPVVALGADLSDGQREEVLNLMGLTEENLANCVVVTVTNDQEHQYLDSYIDSSVIGTKSLSSVMLTKAEEGNGVLVSSKNINYCTTGMYRNALLTAGLEDTNVLVVAPSPMSGTAALIGAVKGYEAMSGETVSDQTLDTALNELITTGELAENTENSEEVEELVAYIKAKLAAGELESDEDIEGAIQEGEQKFGVTLTDEEKEKILEVMHKIKELGLDPQKLLNQAEDLYKKFGNELFDQTEDVIKKSLGESVQNYFSTMSDRFKDFFTNLFKRK
ncbi:MAG: DUF1002 domain-containing protein [Lachnospiraceae bacterium]|nr:DUF1002 domain-containing protein [Lachnospiraceae bacterium]